MRRIEQGIGVGWGRGGLKLCLRNGGIIENDTPAPYCSCIAPHVTCTPLFLPGGLVVLRLQGPADEHPGQAHLRGGSLALRLGAQLRGLRGQVAVHAEDEAAPAGAGGQRQAPLQHTQVRRGGAAQVEGRRRTAMRSMLLRSDFPVGVVDALFTEKPKPRIWGKSTQKPRVKKENWRSFCHLYQNNEEATKWVFE